MPERVVLAYSGGLDTSVAVRWLIENEGVEVVAVAVNVGQAADRGGEDWDAIRARALAAGAVEAVVVDARHEMAEQFCVPALQANARYEGKYPLVSALSRPVIVRHLVAEARRHGATAVAHGCTGKGNDQVRFEVGVRALAPDLGIFAPARVWGLTREDCVELAAKWEIPITVTKEKLYSIDDNLWGKAIECGAIEDPWAPAPDDVYTLTRVTETEPVEVIVGFEAGVPVSLDGTSLGPLRPHHPPRRAGGEPRLRAPRHGGEPAGRHQEPRGLRVPGRAVADRRPRRPRGPDARARPAPREGPPRAALVRARLRRAVVLAAPVGAAGVHHREPAPRHRRGAAALRRAGHLHRGGPAQPGGALRPRAGRPTTRRTPSGTPTPRVSSACGGSAWPRGRPARARVRRSRRGRSRRR